MTGEILPSTAQAMTAGTLIDLVRVVAQSGVTPEKDIYFAFLNASKQGDFGMRKLLESINTDRQVEWIHIQNMGGVKPLPIVLGDANSTTSDRQSAFQLRMQLHGREVGALVKRGYPEEYAPGFYRLVQMDIPHVLIGSGTDKHVAGDEIESLNTTKIDEISRLVQSYIIRDAVGLSKPDFFERNQIVLVQLLLVLAVLCMYLNKLAKTVPGLEIMGRNIRYWSNTRIFNGLSSTIYFVIPAAGLMVFMIYLLLFPKMFVTTEYYGLYSGYSPYLYVKRTVDFIDNLLANGFSLEGQSNIDIRILTSLVSGSFKLVIPAIILSILLGILKGSIDSYKPTDSKNFISLALLSMPDVLVAFIGLQVIVLWSKNEMLIGLIDVDAMRGIVMPVLALSIIPSVYISRLALIVVEEERHKGYIKGVLAKGATKWQAYIHHLLPVMMLKNTRRNAFCNETAYSKSDHCGVFLWVSWYSKLSDYPHGFGDLGSGAIYGNWHDVSDSQHYI